MLLGGRGFLLEGERHRESRTVWGRLGPGLSPGRQGAVVQEARGGLAAPCLLGVTAQLGFITWREKLILSIKQSAKGSLPVSGNVNGK